MAANLAILLKWLREDVISLGGPDHATRGELLDFIVAEHRCREPICPDRISPAVSTLANQRHALAAFAAQLDQELAALATEFQVAVETACAVLNVEVLPADDPSHWQREAALRSQLGSRWFPLSVAMVEVARQTVRASGGPLPRPRNGKDPLYDFLPISCLPYGKSLSGVHPLLIVGKSFDSSQRPRRIGPFGVGSVHARDALLLVAADAVRESADHSLVG